MRQREFEALRNNRQYVILPRRMHLDSSAKAVAHRFLAEYRAHSRPSNGFAGNPPLPSSFKA